MQNENNNLSTEVPKTKLPPVVGQREQVQLTGKIAIVSVAERDEDLVEIMKLALPPTEYRMSLEERVTLAATRLRLVGLRQRRSEGIPVPPREMRNGCNLIEFDWILKNLTSEDIHEIGIAVLDKYRGGQLKREQ